MSKSTFLLEVVLVDNLTAFQWPRLVPPLFRFQLPCRTYSKMASPKGNICPSSLIEFTD